MSLPILTLTRGISTSSTLCGKRNIRKFLFYGKAGTRDFKERQRIKPHPLIPIASKYSSINMTLSIFFIFITNQLKKKKNYF